MKRAALLISLSIGPLQAHAQQVPVQPAPGFIIRPSDLGTVAPALERYQQKILFRDLWLRPGLAPRDRSLATVSAIIASGQFAQLGSHLNRAMENGVTRAEASEILTQLAFYVGWSNAFSAVPVFKGVFDARSP